MRYLRNLLILFTLSLSLAWLTGCGDDDPTGPAPAPLPMVELTWKASSMRVYRDCDSTAARAEGDFHISFKLSEVTGGDEVVLAERSNVIVKASDGAYLSSDDLGISTKAEVPLKDGTRLLVRMSIYENDPDGPQVSIGHGYFYTYSKVSGRWESEDDEGGVTFGQSDSWPLTLIDNQGETCHVVLYGRFSQDVIVK